MKRLLFGTVFTIITISIAFGSATFVFASEDFNSSKSNISDTTQINKKIEDIFLKYSLNKTEINKVKDAFEAGINEDNLKSMLVGFGVDEKIMPDILVNVNGLGINVIHTHGADGKEIKLTDVGLTPDSPFYFFKRATESIGEFFTFGTKAKAELQAKRALERVAEVKVMLAKKNVNQKALDTALNSIKSNITKAAEIVHKEQQKGNNVSAIAKKLDTDFELRRRLLNQTLNEKANQIEFNFKEKKNELKDKLLKARLAGEVKKVSEIKSTLDNIEKKKDDQVSLFNKKKKNFSVILDTGEKELEGALGEKEKNLELKEKEAERTIEQKKEAVKKQFDEAGHTLDLEEKSLGNQLDFAILSGDKKSIESIKSRLIAIGNDASSLESKFNNSKQGFNEINRNLERLRFKKGRNIEDFAQQEELTLKKSEIEMKKAFKEKEVMSKRRFETQKNGLDIQEKRLNFQIFKAKQSCRFVKDPSACFAKKVSPLKDSLVNIDVKKKQVELKADQVDKSIESEGNQIERSIELEKRKSEQRRKEVEKTFEARKKEYEKSKEDKYRKIEQQRENKQQFNELNKKRGEIKRKNGNELLNRKREEFKQAGEKNREDVKQKSEVNGTKPVGI